YLKRMEKNVSESIHKSVLKEEVLEHLNIKKSGVYVDSTLGRAGHAKAIADQLDDNGLLIGFDQDKTAIQAAEQVLPSRSLLIHDNFANLKTALFERDIEAFDG